MPKILILDVDSENIKNFKTYLQMSFPKVKTIYTLTNPATDLLLALREIRPDLIISDIRFFGVGAKKVIHDVSKVYPSTKFILYGTYNDTEYIKSVTEYGVIDFMYRPVKPLDFKRCMEHALRFFAEINAQKQREEELVRDYQKNVLLFQEKFFASVLSGVIEDEAEIMNSFRYFGFQFRGGFTVFIIRIDKFKEIVQNLGDADKHILSYKINNLVNMRIKERAFDGHAFITTFNTVSCVLSNSRSFEEILTFCGETIEDILQTLNLKVTIGLGRTYYSATDIAVSYREADSALQYRFYMGRGVAIPIAFVEPLNTITYKQSHKKQERLIHAAVTGEYEYCVKLLREIFRTFSDSAGGKVQEKLLHRFVMETLFSIGGYDMEIDMDE
ncbi:hypothetical protein AGMMS49975_29450 [Clostridia bacterium]|nr:hypothetical protein AGMMS49975_29450 [Clostridia bacterium]